MNQFAEQCQAIIAAIAKACKLPTDPTDLIDRPQTEASEDGEFDDGFRHNWADTL
jgi:hypothetical protein